jgi:hypothetical protein
MAEDPTLHDTPSEPEPPPHTPEPPLFTGGRREPVRRRNR